MDTQVDARDVFRIPAQNWSALVARFEKFGRRQARLSKKGPLADTTPITVEHVDTEELPPECLACGQTEDQHHGPAKTCREGILDSFIGETWAPGPVRIVFIARVTGAAAKIDGWEFIATLQHEEGGTILRTVPTATIAEGELNRFRDVKPHCEHCKHKRRRKDSFVVRNVETGALQQVGRNCLGAYLGGADPKAVAALAELLISVRSACGDAEEDGWCGDGGEIRAFLNQFLTYTVASIRCTGWVSRTAARDDHTKFATADHVWLMLFPVGDTDKKAAAEFARKITDEHAEVAKAALARAEQDLQGDKLSDYEHNLRVAIGGSSITHRNAGLAASLIPWYERKLSREAERAERQKAQDKAREESRHIGAVKDRLELTVTVLGVYDNESDWGVTHWHRMVTEDGNAVTWRSSSKRLEAGQRYRLRGTVKHHDEWKGIKQTALTRCAVLEEGA